jgi:TIGR03987 family protein
MSSLLLFAIISMVLALTCYTIGVFAERKKGILLPWHAVIFWLGFFFDSTGTRIMSHISGGQFAFNLHGITGLIALLLMAFHALWATVILIRKKRRSQENFHKFSILVWAIWLIPFVIGIFIGMS